MYEAKKDISILCKECGKEHFVSKDIARKTSLNGHLCYDCYQKSKGEVKMAILNMAIRKYRKRGKK